MSNPQLENGFTRIANELLEAILKHPFTKRELNVVLSVIRKTYGYGGKKHDAVSSVQIEFMTGIDQSHISKTINNLIKNNILIKKGSGRLSHGKHIKSIGINKRYKMWTTTAKTASVDDIQNSPSSTAKTASLSTAKTAYTKEKKEKRKGEINSNSDKTQHRLTENNSEDVYLYYRRIGNDMGLYPKETDSREEYISRVKNAQH